jgi:chorismate-pyruvate lyase
VAVALDFLAKTLLEAPVGHVEQTVKEILKRPVHLQVIGQDLVSGTKYHRKIVIASGQMPIVHAIVKFDSKNIPKLIMTELLEKKKGIGNILQKHCIDVHRDILKINVESDGKKLTRNYHILHDSVVWFDITEEIRLDFLNTCQNV